MKHETSPSSSGHQFSASHEALQRKIADGTARVGIVGLGYVGLPLARAFASKGMAVLGFDLDSVKIAKLQRGESYIGHIPPEVIRAMGDQGFEATACFD